MARFSLNRSQRATLSAAIRKFNTIVESLGVGVERKFNYATLRDSIHTKRQYETIVKRIKRIQNPKEQQILTSLSGAKYLKWEDKEFKRLQRAGNRKRAKIREQLKAEREIGYMKTDAEIYYANRERSLHQVANRDAINRWFKSEENFLDPGYEKKREEQFKVNLIKSLHEWPDVEPIQELKELIASADVNALRIIVADSRMDVSLKNNYAALYAFGDDEDLVDAAEDLFSRWKVNLDKVSERFR